MKILIVDPSCWPYDTRTPAQRSLGGTQSAVVYLARELARLGHQPVVVNGVPEPVTTEGVGFLALPIETPYINSFDVIVVVGGAMGRILRDIGATRPLVLWCHHATDQPAVQGLRQAEDHALYAGFAMVSQWQADDYQAVFGLPAEKIQILRNAVSPWFLEMPSRPNWIERGEPPVLAYTSTPFRGLDLLLMGFSAIRARIPGARLQVYSSMGLYNAPSADEPGAKDIFAALYDLCRALPGAEYIGPLPQPQLADAMRQVDILAYPCTFPETSCIAAMEAMAAGCLLITTPKGALPETTAGFAELVDFGGLIPSAGVQATHYADFLVENLGRWQADSSSLSTKLQQQRDFARSTYSWRQRAQEWSDWLAGMV